MAVTIQKLLATKNPISVSLTISIFLLFLVTNVRSESFNFPNFPPDIGSKGIGFANDATLKDGVIQLTKKDEAGNPLKHSVGQSGRIIPIRIYDKSSGKVADFVTDFIFSVNRKGRKDYGDGFAFFMIPPDFTFPDKTKSDGGLLGMFTRETAFKSNAQQVLLVEFDSFANEWDPNPVSQFSHLGIDVNSIKSVAVAPWFNFDGLVAKARIEYNSQAKKLSVRVTSTIPVNAGESSLIYDIDLRTVLPEMVTIGFSAATGNLVETHDILSWSFTSNL